MKNFTLMILCAGFGSRMLNLTRNTPKPLLKYKNKILLKNTIDFFTNIGCDEILVKKSIVFFNNILFLYFNKGFGVLCVKFNILDPKPAHKIIKVKFFIIINIFHKLILVHNF